MKQSDYPGMQPTPCQQQQFGGGSGGGNSTQTQKFEPPGYTTDTWQQYLDQAANTFSQPYQQYQGMQIAPQGQDTGLSQEMVRDSALYGAPDTNTARGAVSQIAGGQFFGLSPWTDSKYTNNVINQNAQNMGNAAAIGQNAQDDAMFARNGAYGGSAWQQKQGQNSMALNNAVGQMANNYQLQNAQMGNSNYNQGVQQMLQAAQLGYGGQGLDMQAASALNSSGNQQNQYLQSLLGNQQQDFNQQQQFPYQNLQAMLQALSGASGNYGTTTSNPYAGSANPWTTGAGIAGLLGAGYQAFS